MELLSCSKLHLWCISEELHGDNLLSTGIPEHLSQEWLRQILKQFHIITQIPLCVIDGVINQMPFLSLGEAISLYLLRKSINSLAHLLQLLV